MPGRNTALSEQKGDDLTPQAANVRCSTAPPATHVAARHRAKRKSQRFAVFSAPLVQAEDRLRVVSKLALINQLAAAEAAHAFAPVLGQVLHESDSAIRKFVSDNCRTAHPHLG